MALSRRSKYICLAIAVLIIAALWAGMTLWEKTTRRFAGSESAWIVIPGASSYEAILDTLKNSLGYDFGKTVYEVWEILKGEAGRAHGAYRIEPDDKVLDIARRLKAGNQTPVRVTFNNVRLFNELPEKVARSMEFSEAQFVQACDRILPAKGFDKAHFIAAFVPDTYEFYWTTPADKTVDRLLSYRNRFWTPERRGKADALGLTPLEVATLASIVDEETSIADEKGTIARLYLNRLQKHMRLQADPTVKFAVGDFSLRRILKQHLEKASPYNTYIVDGLPRGPIRMPEKATIDAVLNAPHNNYLYMCAKDDFSGRHNFASTLEQHNANASRYRSALDARGIK